MVSAIVQERNHRHWLLGKLRDPDDPVDAWTGLVSPEPHLVLAADCITIDGFLLILKLRDQRIRLRRLFTVHLFGEDSENLLAALCPVSGGLHLAPIDERERILKRIRRDLRFIVVRRIDKDIPILHKHGLGLRGEGTRRRRKSEHQFFH